MNKSFENHFEKVSKTAKTDKLYKHELLLFKKKMNSHP